MGEGEYEQVAVTVLFCWWKTMDKSEISLYIYRTTRYLATMRSNQISMRYISKYIRKNNNDDDYDGDDDDDDDDDENDDDNNNNNSFSYRAHIVRNM